MYSRATSIYSFTRQDDRVVFGVADLLSHLQGENLERSRARSRRRRSLRSTFCPHALPAHSAHTHYHCTDKACSGNACGQNVMPTRITTAEAHSAHTHYHCTDKALAHEMSTSAVAFSTMPLGVVEWHSRRCHSVYRRCHSVCSVSTLPSPPHLMCADSENPGLGRSPMNH